MKKSLKIFSFLLLIFLIAQFSGFVDASYDTYEDFGCTQTGPGHGCCHSLINYVEYELVDGTEVPIGSSLDVSPEDRGFFQSDYDDTHLSSHTKEYLGYDFETRVFGSYGVFYAIYHGEPEDCVHDSSCSTYGCGAYPGGNHKYSNVITTTVTCSNCGEKYIVESCEDSLSDCDKSDQHDHGAKPNPKAPESNTDYLSAQLLNENHLYMLGECLHLKGTCCKITTKHYRCEPISETDCPQYVNVICEKNIPSHARKITCTEKIICYDTSIPDGTTTSKHNVTVSFSGFTANNKSSININTDTLEDISWNLSNLKITSIDKNSLKKDNKGSYGIITVSCSNSCCSSYKFNVYFKFFYCHMNDTCNGVHGHHQPTTYPDHPINDYAAFGIPHICSYCGETYYTDVSCTARSSCHNNSVCSIHQATYQAHPIDGYTAKYGSYEQCDKCGKFYYVNVSCSNDDHSHNPKCNGGNGDHEPASLTSHPINGYYAEATTTYCPTCNAFVPVKVTCSKKPDTLSIKSIRDLRWQSYFTNGSSYQGPLLVKPNSNVLLNKTSPIADNGRTLPKNYYDYPYIGMGYAVEFEVSVMHSNDTYLQVDSTIWNGNKEIKRNQLTDFETGLPLSHSNYNQYFNFNSKGNSEHFTSITHNTLANGIKTTTYSFIFLLPPKTYINDASLGSPNHIDVKLDIRVMNSSGKVIQTYAQFLDGLGINWNGKVFSYSTTRSLLNDIDNDLTN